MSKHHKPGVPAHVKQQDILTPANKRYMIYLTTTVVMLCAAIIMTT